MLSGPSVVDLRRLASCRDLNIVAGLWRKWLAALPSCSSPQYCPWLLSAVAACIRIAATEHNNWVICQLSINLVPQPRIHLLAASNDGRAGAPKGAGNHVLSAQGAFRQMVP